MEGAQEGEKCLHVSLCRDGGCLRPSIFCIGLRLPFQISERLTRAGNELLPLRGRGKEEKGRGERLAT